MTPRLIDQIMSIDGILVGTSYVVAYSVIVVVAVAALDWRERRIINRRAAKAKRLHTSPEDVARWTP